MGNEFTEKRGPGRPKMKDESRRDKTIKIRLTEYEYMRLKADSMESGKSISDSIRKRVFN